MRPRVFLSLSTSLAILLACGLASAPAQEAAPAGIDPDALARIIPGEGLLLYLEFQGLEAYPDAWRQTATHAILNDTKTGAMLAELLTQLVNQTSGGSPGARLSGEDVNILIGHLFNRGFALGVFQVPGNPRPKMALVIRDAFAEDVRGAVGKFLGATGMATPGAKVADKPGGRRVVLQATDPTSAWWVEGGKDLVVADEVDTVIAGIGGEKTAANSPVRKQLLTAEGGFRPVAVAFLQPPPGSLPPQAAQLGLDKFQRLDYRWGFEGRALRSELRMVAPAPRSGLLALLDQPAFGLDSLPPIDAEADSFTVVSIDPGQAYDQIASLARATGGEPAAQAIDAMEKAVRDATRKDLREDILSQIGPKVSFYTLPDKKSGLGAMAAAVTPKLGIQVPKFVAFVELKDAKRFSGTLAELISVLNKQLAEIPAAGAAPGGRKPQPTELRMTTPEPPTWILSLPTQLAALTNARLTVTIGKSHLILASAPDLARDAIALEAQAEGRWTPTGEYAEAVAGLPSKLVFLQVSDPRGNVPQGLAQLPDTLQQVIAMMGTVGAAAGAAGPMAGGPGGPPGRGYPGAPGSGYPGSSGSSGYPGDPGSSGGGGPPPGLVRQSGGPPPGLVAQSGGPPPGLVGGAGGPPSGADPLASLAALKLDIPQDQRPDPKAIAALLFPGAAAATVDDQGLTIITREAFPQPPDAASAGIAAALLMPAIQSARDAALRAAGQAPGAPGAPGAEPAGAPGVEPAGGPGPAGRPGYPGRSGGPGGRGGVRPPG